MELLTIIKCPAARGRGGARPNPSIIGARSSCVSCTPLYPLCTVCTTIVPRVLHFSAVHYCCDHVLFALVHACLIWLMYLPIARLSICLVLGPEAVLECSIHRCVHIGMNRCVHIGIIAKMLIIKSRVADKTDG